MATITDQQKTAWLRENATWFFSNGNYAYEVLQLGFDATIERLMRLQTRFPGEDDSDE